MPGAKIQRRAKAGKLDTRWQTDRWRPAKWGDRWNRLSGLHRLVKPVEERFEGFLKQYRTLREKLEAQPELKQKPGWFSDITGVFWNLRRASNVLDRFELQKTKPTIPVEVQVIRLGEMVIATNRFELYVDYGTQIKGRSRAVQTFVVQLAGQASYLPIRRSIAGGAYGAIPESTLIGPEGGGELVDRTVELIGSLWSD